MKKVIRKAERRMRKILNRLIVDTGDYRRTVFLAGTGPSGTTWVEELINAKNDFRIMFEPFHSDKVELVSDWNYRQYLRCSDRTEKFLQSATAILSGNIRNEWIDCFNRKLISRKRIIKDIRANHILKWIKCNFPEIPIILLLRHPCAVAHSKLRLNWETHLHDFLIQDELMEDFLDPFKSELQDAKTVFDKHIFMWCIENYVPLKQFSDGELLVVFYENICTQTEQEMQRLCSFIGQRFSPASVDKSSIPSALSRKQCAINSGDDLVSSWRKSISDDQIERAVEILGIFGLQNIYNENDYPLLSGSEALRLFPTECLGTVNQGGV